MAGVVINKFLCYLLLGGLAEEVNKDIIHAAFIPFGEIIDIQIPLDYETRILLGIVIILKFVNILKFC